MDQIPVQKVSSDLMDRAARVGQHIDIFDIRLTAQETRLQQLAESTTLQLRVGHGAESKRDVENNRIVINATFSFELFNENDESQSNADAVIRAIFSLGYNVKELDTLSDEDIRAFGTVSGVMQAWPFWRELVYSTMSRMGLPPMTLPTFRLINEESAIEKTTSSAQPL